MLSYWHVDDQLHLPLSYGEDGRSKEKKRKRRVGILHQPSSDAPMRSLSIYNPQMEVLTSIIGHSVVHRTSENVGGQKILCLDGGGVKVNKLQSFEAISFAYKQAVIIASPYLWLVVIVQFRFLNYHAGSNSDWDVEDDRADDREVDQWAVWLGGGDIHWRNTGTRNDLW